MEWGVEEVGWWSGFRIGLTLDIIQSTFINVWDDKLPEYYARQEDADDAVGDLGGGGPKEMLRQVAVGLDAARAVRDLAQALYRQRGGERRQRAEQQ